MRQRYVVDTNVLIIASVAHPSTPKDIDTTPQDPALQFRVWQWLVEFESSPARLVLDSAGKIEEEYGRKLGFNDYGIQVLIHKWSTLAVDNVDVQYDNNGHAVLQPPLDSVVHDLADRKMVAAALEARKQYGESAIAFAGDTDWHDWEQALTHAGLSLEPLIEDWSRAKHAEKANK
ncbi:hypothetical protein ABO04_01065 [Nitrosomonas sp. HPC101]|uniref:hypothetical protein n=1 Tax=Nitrosomonas sp. HPC101 TaxID=1658667 RepID=UPI00136CF444|nr:hypothetical protein [Nitrosomonas sp. HPC101]MXS84535.1 hypothetical protein [Nitrosomonas sp. HPC101]